MNSTIVSRAGARGTTSPLHRGQWAPHPAPEAAERLGRYLRDNPDTPLTVDFNGEVRGPWVFRQVVSRFIRVEITPLRKRLIDFEREYLLHGEEAVAAELARRRAMTATPAASD